jgi:hypothetical protein
MQTFLPYADFLASARVLDQRRLGNQRVEAMQLLNSLTVPGHGWRHHPASLMWRDHEEALARYGLDVCDVWVELGFSDTVAAKISAALADRLGITTVRTQAQLADAGELPPWLGDERLHRSHRSSLLRKDPAHYRPLFGDEPDDLPYFWPTAAGAGS